MGKKACSSQSNIPPRVAARQMAAGTARAALGLGRTSVDGAGAPKLFLANKFAGPRFGGVRPRQRATGQTKFNGPAMGLNRSADSLQHYSLFELFGFWLLGRFLIDTCWADIFAYFRWRNSRGTALTIFDRAFFKVHLGEDFELVAQRPPFLF